MYLTLRYTQYDHLIGYRRSARFECDGSHSQTFFFEEIRNGKWVLWLLVPNIPRTYLNVFSIAFLWRCLGLKCAHLLVYQRRVEFNHAPEQTCFTVLLAKCVARTLLLYRSNSALDSEGSLVWQNEHTTCVRVEWRFGYTSNCHIITT